MLTPRLPAALPLPWPAPPLAPNAIVPAPRPAGAAPSSAAPPPPPRAPRPRAGACAAAAPPWPFATVLINVVDAVVSACGPGCAPLRCRMYAAALSAAGSLIDPGLVGGIV